tara:strand:- start:628 stop:1308 length:681 start_codon:yes stop_codon:yes gene_type:complete
MFLFKSCEFIKDYFIKNKLKNIILISQARSGSTFATHSLSKFIGFDEKNIYPEEYFSNKHFLYLKKFILKHEYFFLNINEFILKRTKLNRNDTLFIYLYRDPEEIMNSYKKSEQNGYYKGWVEFYARYRPFFREIKDDQNTACFNHEIWSKQQNYFTHCLNIHFNSLKELSGFKTNRDNFENLKQIGDNEIISLQLKNKINFNFLEKFYFFLRRKLESRKKIINNY